MFGNLLRESGVVDRLAKGAQNELANIVTILLGLAISTKMTGEDFLRPMTLGIMGLGLVAFVQAARLRFHAVGRVNHHAVPRITFGRTE